MFDLVRRAVYARCAARFRDEVATDVLSELWIAASSKRGVQSLVGFARSAARTLQRRALEHESAVRLLDPELLRQQPARESAPLRESPVDEPGLLRVQGKRQRWLCERVQAGATFDGLIAESGMPRKELRRLFERVIARLWELRREKT